jgi:hypothetical protein
MFGMLAGYRVAHRSGNPLVMSVVKLPFMLCARHTGCSPEGNYASGGVGAPGSWPVVQGCQMSYNYDQVTPKERRIEVRTFVALALGILISITCVQFSKGQTEATPQVAHQVKQGDIISITITLDKAPNFDGGPLSVSIAPVAGGIPPIGTNTSLQRGEREISLHLRIPLDAPTGRWAVSEITFNGSKLELHGHSFFDVVPHGELVVPSSATISHID